MKINKILLFSLGFFSCIHIFSQAVYEGDRYVPETDSTVLDKLDQWQDKKFGLLMHWGPYSQWGIVESWSLCPEDYGWTQRKKGENPENYYAYKKEYEGLKNTFDPVNFNPEKWAKAARAAGMKYMVFTTKHHDGFTMFDSKYTNYKVTDPECAFSSDPRANITKEIFNAFREKDFWIGAYFSKPDWHHENYWDPYFPPLDRNVNYDPKFYPEKWQKYVDFTHNQIMELMTDYGKVDILWLDGGWVANMSDEEVARAYQNKFKENTSGNGFIKHRVVSQDIKMDELVTKARKKQPGLIVVDRAVHGKNQNYLTPENRVPEKTLPYPWESCIISGGGWSHTFDAKYKSGREAIQLLVGIVAKGGNLLLNIAPGPDGTWQQGAYNLLRHYADWMKINSEAIYQTRPISPFKSDNICFTQNKKGEVFFFYLAAKGEDSMPEKIRVNGIYPKKGAKISLLGHHKRLKWTKTEEGFFVSIPENIRHHPKSNFVWTFKINKIEQIQDHENRDYLY